MCVHLLFKRRWPLSIVKLGNQRDLTMQDVNREIPEDDSETLGQQLHKLVIFLFLIKGITKIQTFYFKGNG